MVSPQSSHSSIGALVEAAQRLVDLAEQELLAVAEAQLGGEDLLLHRLVDRVAADVALPVHAELEPVLGVLDEPRAFGLERGAELALLRLVEHAAQDIDRARHRQRAEMCADADAPIFRACVSKAFTKEGDGGAPDELPPVDAWPAGVKNYLTPAGHAALKREIEAVRAAPRADPTAKLRAEARLQALLRRLEAAEVIDPRSAAAATWCASAPR